MLHIVSCFVAALACAATLLAHGWPLGAPEAALSCAAAGLVSVAILSQRRRLAEWLS